MPPPNQAAWRAYRRWNSYMTYADELACTRLAIAWGYHLDRHENSQIAALFAEDGVLHSKTGVDAVGSAAIVAVLGKRDANRVTRHFLAPPFIEVIGENRAQGVIPYTVFEGFRGKDEAQGPMPLLPPVTVGEFRQTYRRTQDGWRIATSRSAPIFKQQ